MKNKFGEEIRKIRKAQGETLVETAQSLGIDRSHLTKVELGQDRPSEKLFMSLIAHFSVERVTALRLWSLAGFTGEFVTGESSIGGKEENAMNSPMIQPQPQVASVNMDPSKPTLYTDSIFVNASDFGIVVDFGRRVSPEQHFIVTSVGMSYDHAKKLIEILSDQIEKNER